MGGCSTVGGGVCNKACGMYSVVIGGWNNTASGYASSVVGYNLTNTCDYSLLTCCLRAANLAGAAGAICVNATCTIIRATSDLRCKTSICPITYGLCDIEKLNPVSFYWCENIKCDYGCNKQIGFIAQEVDEVVPETVSVDNHGLYSLDSPKLIPVIVKSIQEINLKLKEIEDRIKKLESL
jgi:hypothetical protein